MQAALDGFNLNIGRVRALHALGASFQAQLTPAVDLSDLLRAEVVLAVSALDQFVHEIARTGMIESWTGLRARTEAFSRFALPTSVVSALLEAPGSTGALETEIRSRHSYVTFQHPDKIAEAVRLFSDIKLWELVAAELNEEPKTVKASLILIVDRRNKIAHEADVDPSYPGQRWPIDVFLVESIFARIETLANAIFVVAH
jgi:hypothetical protein